MSFPTRLWKIKEESIMLAGLYQLTPTAFLPALIHSG